MNQIALITGASRGIGKAIARRLHKDQFHVYLNYYQSKQAAEALAAELSSPAICADVSDYAAVSEMIAQIGRIDLLVCNAGLSYYGLLSDTTPSHFQKLLNVNLRGVYNCCQNVIPQMVSRKHGNIILVSSIWGITGASCEAAYAATKAGVISLAKSLAQELGPSGIRVNCIAPGCIETDMMADFSEQEKKDLCYKTPLGRLGTPEDVANIAGFLASSQASFITGQTITVDGGFLLS